MADRGSGRSYRDFLVWGFGIFILIGGIGAFSDGLRGIITGFLWVVTGLIIIPPTRRILFESLAKRDGPDLTTAGTGVIVLIVLIGVVAGAAIVPPSDTQSEQPTEPTSPQDTTHADSEQESSSSTENPKSGAESTDSEQQSDEYVPPDDRDSETSSDEQEPRTTSPTDEDTSGSSDGTSLETQSAWTVTVIDVIDGDTMDVRMPDGSTDRIRLLGVDTPETSTTGTDPSEWNGIPSNLEGRIWLSDWGNEATGYAEERLGSEEIYIEVDDESDRRGSFDRLLVYAYQSESSDKSFNLRLIENGYARMYDTSFSKRSAFLSAEQTAQNREIGVWDYTASSTGDESAGSSSGGLYVVTIHEDATGNDHENLNDEYIVLENQGDSSIDLSGWVLSDDADHKYTFPSGFELDPGDTVTIYTGSGSDTDSELYWGSDRAIWNNSGDTVILSDDSGDIQIERAY